LAPTLADVVTRAAEGEAAGPSTGARANRILKTREAIVAAALDLAAERPDRRLTAELIAERAGVSRRTFFNYFPSVEAAFFAPVQRLLIVAVEHLERIPEGTPFADALAQAMTGASEEEPLDRLGLCAHLGSRMPQFRGSELEQWDAADALLTEAFERRYPHVEPFTARCLTGAVIGVARAAIHEWDRRTGGRPSARSAALLHDLIADSLRHVASGFAHSVDAGPTRPRD
jgi:AcrR family transcriptional regulator